MKDENTWILAIRDRPNRFGEVYDAFADRVFQYALKRTANYHVARDVTAETFMKAFMAIQRFKWQGVNIEVWLFQIALNEIRLYYRRRKYRPEETREHWPAHWEKRTGSAEEEYIRIEEQLQQSERLMELAGQIETLPEAQRECITLKYLENFTSPEIARILKMKESTVRSHIHRGLGFLRLKLKK